MSGDDDSVKVRGRPLEEAEKEALRAQARKFNAEAQAAEDENRREQEEHDIRIKSMGYQEERDRFALASHRRAEDLELAQDRHHFTYWFTDPVSKSSVKGCVDNLNVWARTAEASGERAHITLVFDSPGGDVMSGMDLFDRILAIRHTGHTVKTVALGHAASMAGILLQAGAPRVMGQQSFLLLHEVAFGAIGKIGEVEDTVTLGRKMMLRVLGVFATRAADALIARKERSGKTRDQVIAERKRYIGSHWKRKDWWLDSEEAYKAGLVDELLTPGL